MLVVGGRCTERLTWCALAHALCSTLLYLRLSAGNQPDTSSCNGLEGGTARCGRSGAPGQGGGGGWGVKLLLSPPFGHLPDGLPTEGGPLKGADLIVLPGGVRSHCSYSTLAAPVGCAARSGVLACVYAGKYRSAHAKRSRVAAQDRLNPGVAVVALTRLTTRRCERVGAAVGSDAAPPGRRGAAVWRRGAAQHAGRVHALPTQGAGAAGARSAPAAYGSTAPAAAEPTPVVRSWAVSRPQTHQAVSQQARQIASHGSLSQCLVPSRHAACTLGAVTAVQL